MSDVLCARYEHAMQCLVEFPVSEFKYKIYGTLMFVHAYSLYCLKFSANLH